MQRLQNKHPAVPSQVCHWALLDSGVCLHSANMSVDVVLILHCTSISWLCRNLCQVVDFSCSLNIFILALLQNKLCSWMTDVLSDRKQRASLGRHISDSPSALILLKAAFLSLYQKLHLSLSISWSLKTTLSHSKKPRSTEGWCTLYIIISPQTLKELHINKLH